jgi:prepilin-type N-terminal cleavage/methylation domain-containing protein
MSTSFYKSKLGFTLIELLVVIAIIGLLASIVMVSLNSSRANARDAKRQEDLQQLRLALELYFNKNGEYPVGGWFYFEQDGANYIPGLLPTYMPVLPRDSLAGQTCPGGIGPGGGGDLRTYFYLSIDGTQYKANVCSENIVPASSPFYDTVRGGYAWMICSGETACTTY